jgi:phage baseplate assembly protein W
MATTLLQPFGITLPITRGEQGYFNQSFTLIDQIKSNLKLLLQTKKGERRMNPEFGSGLWNILFESNTEEFKTIIESTIRKDIETWMRYVNVQKITIEDNAANPNRIDVAVVFTVPSAGITQSQSLEVSMNSQQAA